MNDDDWNDFYDARFAALVLDRKRDGLPATIDRLITWLRLSRGQRVFDQCCGNGRVGLPLARAGLGVVGVDATEGYIDEANRLAQAESLDARFVHADARSFVAAPRCDAAINWGTSFGHAAKDEDNVAILRRVFESLRPGGRFALEYPHVPNLLRDFQPSIIQRVQTAGGEVILIRESTLEFTRGQLAQVWTYVLPNGERVEKRGATRLYLPHELARMTREAGFDEIELFDSAGAPLSRTSAKCVMLAR